VEVGANGTQVTGAVKLRAAIPGGSVFIAEGTHEQPANALTESLVEVRRVAGPAEPEPSAVPAQVAPAAEGLAEMPPSAPLPLPPTPPEESP
jgi:NADH-quinone oxidoreductase subunit G